MIHCDRTLDLHREQIYGDKGIINYFNSKSNLTKVYGHMGDNWVMEQLSTLFLDANHIPLSDNLPPVNSKGKLNMSVYREARQAIDKWDKSLSGQVNSFEAFARTPSAIFRKNPITIKFNNRISSILNNERKNKSVYLADLKQIAHSVKNIMSVVNDSDGSYGKVSNKMDKLYTKISEATSNGDTDGATRALNELAEVMTSQDSQKVLTTLTDMVENNDMTSLNNILKSGTKEQVTLAGVAKEIKGFLGKMGDVNIHGLEKMKGVVDRFFTKTNNTRAEAIKRNIDSAIERMKEGKERGTYFPHYSVENLLSLETVIDNINPFKIMQDIDYQTQVLNDIEGSISTLPTNVLASSSDKRKLFVQDPIRVLEMYAQNASMFNKKQFMMDAYLEAMADIVPRSADFDGLAQIAEYMANKYTATMKGYTDANDAVKAVSGAIAKVQTISKMGLSLTGAIRNSTQQFWYVNYVGYKRYKKGRDVLKSGETYTYSIEDGAVKERDINTIINNVSKEAGYFFDSASKEIVSKGAITQFEGVDRNNMRMTLDENGNPKVEFKQDGVWRKFDKSLGKVAGKALVFHQWTENLVRSDVYKNSFASHFDMLFRNESYKQREAQRIAKERNISVDKAMNAVHKSIETQSHNMALNWVRMTQFEYTTPDRPNGFGGGTTNASVLGNSVFQFFPYAAHMFEMNSRVYKEGLQAMFNGDVNNWKFGAMMRMFGFQTFGIGLASIVLNNEFRYLIENDTFSRLTNLYRLFTAEDMTEADFGNGLLSQLSGPVVADMLFWMEAAGMSDFGDEGIQQLLMGYYDIANKAESDRDRMMANRVSVQLAKVLKSKESFVNGDITGMIRNNFLMYPSEFTREGHAKMMDMFGVETPRARKKKEAGQVSQVLSSLQEDQRGKILNIIQDIRESSQVDRSIPTGLENLSIR